MRGDITVYYNAIKRIITQYYKIYVNKFDNLR